MLTRAEQARLVALIVESLRVRVGETLTEAVIDERARNLATALEGEYEITPVKNDFNRGQVREIACVDFRKSELSYEVES